MTSEEATAKAGMGAMVADHLRDLGVRGVLVQDGRTPADHRAPVRNAEVLLPQREGSLRPEIKPSWEPSPDLYPRLKSDGGHLDP